MIGKNWDRNAFEKAFGLEPVNSSDLFEDIKLCVEILTSGCRLTISAIARGWDSPSDAKPESVRRAVERVINDVRHSKWPSGGNAQDICWSILQMVDNELLCRDNGSLDNARWDGRKNGIVFSGKEKAFSRQKSPFNSIEKLLEDVNKLSVLGYLADAFEKETRQDDRFAGMIVELAHSIRGEISTALRGANQQDERLFSDPWLFIQRRIENQKTERLELARKLKEKDEERYSAIIRVLEA